MVGFYIWTYTIYIIYYIYHILYMYIQYIIYIIHIYIYTYIYININFVCHANIYIYQKWDIHLFLNELYFGFFQTFEDFLEETEI